MNNMHTTAPATREALPPRFCNVERLLHAMQARDIDGLVVSTPLNMFYLTSFHGVAHKSDEPRPFTFILSRHEPENPIIVIGDYYLANFVEQPSWVQDIRPFRAVMMPLDRAPTSDDINPFVPAGVRDSALMRNARKEYQYSQSAAIHKALADLKLDTARIAFDDIGVGYRLGINPAQIADAYDPLMFARSVKTPTELELLRRATALNEQAIHRTIAAWDKGATWRDLNLAYATAVAQLGGFVRDPGGMVWGHPRGSDSTVMLSTGLEDHEVEPGTHVMFDCHGTLDLYCWDGGKTWVVDGEPEAGAKRYSQATACVADMLVQEMKPGVKISQLQAKGREIYRREGVPDADSAIIFFHGLGLSHMDIEITTADGQPNGDWTLEENMVAPVHLLYPGNEHERIWLEDVIRVTADGGEPLFSWGFDPLIR
jgi:Xaa-Pro aminopeptidase